MNGPPRRSSNARTIFARFQWLCLLVASLLVAPGTSRLMGDESAETVVDQAAPVQERVVVLRNGHAFVGAVDQAGDRMTITQGPGRSVRVPLRDVDIVVDTLHDAYVHRRQRLHPGEINDQMRLAQWCLRYQLEDEAAELLLEMSRRYPNHHAVRALERQMGERAGLLAGSGRDASAVRTASFQQAEVAPDAMGFPLAVPSAPEELGELPSLSPAEITEFTRVVQPLLQNRCGNANCHASNGRSAFVLQRTPTGRLTFKDLTWSNLRAAWKQVDLRDPERSPLIVMATTPHGGQSRAPLETYESRPRQRLARWVVSATQADAIASGETPSAAGPAHGQGLPANLGPLGNGRAGGAIVESTSAGGGVTFGLRPAPLTPLQRLQAAGARVSAAKDALQTNAPNGLSPELDGGVQRASFLEADPLPAPSPPAVLPPPVPTTGPLPAGNSKTLASPRAVPAESATGDPFDPEAFNARFHPE